MKIWDENGREIEPDAYLPLSMRVFGEQPRGELAYEFTMPHIAISGLGIKTEFDTERKQWHLVQDSDGFAWEVWADDQVGGILALIAKRTGLGTITFTPDPPEEE